MALQIEKEAKTCCKCESLVGTFYDIVAELISILDVTTDVIVCIQFYQADRTIFFGISLTILCLALIAYDITFIYLFARHNKAHENLALFFILILFTPFLPFVFYFTYEADNYLSLLLERICCIHIDIEDRSYIDSNASSLRRFFQEKVQKHVGFILESLVEAFPQAILQMTAVVVYNEANTIAILSILLSILSLASKSFVFSIASATNLKQLFFNWLCAVTDVFGIFFVVSWVFHQPDHDLAHAFNTIQRVWLYKLYILVFPLMGVGSFLFSVCLWYEIVSKRSSICLHVFSILLILFILGCVMIGAVLSCEILTFTYAAATFYMLGTRRIPKTKPASECFWTLVKWINSAQKHHVGSRYKGCTSYTKKQDRMMRLSAANYMMYTTSAIYANDNECVKYLEQQRDENQYLNVTMKGLRTHSVNVSRSSFTGKFWRWYTTIWRDFADDFGECSRYGFIAIFLAIMHFILGPMYLVSRVMNFIFPFWIILYLYFVYDVNIWNSPSVDLFQVVMMSIYLCLICIVSVLFHVNAVEQYLMAHILPSQYTRFTMQTRLTDGMIKQITNYYYGIVVIPIRKAIVIEKFGSDLGPIILSFLPLDDHYDASNKELIKVKTVV
eukprot:260585_1